jgi:hypothetical protein
VIFERIFLPNGGISKGRSLDVPLEEVVFFLQGAASAAEAANEQNGYTDRYDQCDGASADKNPVKPVLCHHSNPHPNQTVFFR